MRPATHLAFKEVIDCDTNVGRDTSTTGLVVDGNIVSNAIALADWSATEAELNVCEYCGALTCGVGPDAHLHRVLGWLCVSSCLSTSENVDLVVDELRELYVPAALLSTEQQAELKAHGANLSALSSYQLLPDAVAQVAVVGGSPAGVLHGHAAAPRVRTDMLTTCTGADVDEAVAALERVLRSTLSLPEVVSDDVDKVTFYVGEPLWTEWTPLVRRRSRWGLLLFDDVVVWGT